MSNFYCSAAQFKMLYDSRLSDQLTSDDGTGVLVGTTLDFILDCAASEMESYLFNRWVLPPRANDGSIPKILTLVVARRAISMLFGRRNDLPKGVQADVEWADKFFEMLQSGVANIPNVDRLNQIAIDNSPAPDGSSRFDFLPDFDKSGNTANS